MSKRKRKILKEYVPPKWISYNDSETLSDDSEEDLHNRPGCSRGVGPPPSEVRKKLLKDDKDHDHEEPETVFLLKKNNGKNM